MISRQHQSKKSTILYTAKILREGSDRLHPVTQATIVRTLALLGIQCDRKTVSRDIDCLIEFGYNIVKLRGGGCYYNGQDFLDEEITYLLQAVDKVDMPGIDKTVLKNKVKKLANVFYDRL